MGHYLATVNPQAAANIEERPLPQVGDPVVYYPRPHEVRRGRKEVAAVVTHVDKDNRRLDLVLFYEAADWGDAQGVPEHVGEERGWMRKEVISTVQINRDPDEIAGLRKEIADLRALVLGDFERPPEAIMHYIEQLDARLDKLEAVATAPAAVIPETPQKRKPGRPRKVVAVEAPPCPPKRHFGPASRFGQKG